MLTVQFVLEMLGLVLAVVGSHSLQVSALLRSGLGVWWVMLPVFDTFAHIYAILHLHNWMREFPAAVKEGKFALACHCVTRLVISAFAMVWANRLGRWTVFLSMPYVVVGAMILVSQVGIGIVYMIVFFYRVGVIVLTRDTEHPETERYLAGREADEIPYKYIVAGAGVVLGTLMSVVVPAAIVLRYLENGPYTWGLSFIGVFEISSHLSILVVLLYNRFKYTEYWLVLTVNIVLSSVKTMGYIAVLDLVAKDWRLVPLLFPFFVIFFVAFFVTIVWLCMALVDIKCPRPSCMCCSKKQAVVPIGQYSPTPEVSPQSATKTSSKRF